MQIRELAIPDAWEFTPKQHGDDRGVFFEFYRFEKLEEVVGHPLTLRQGNMSVSSRGVARGIHYATVAPGQAKYVMAPRGAFVDYIIDLRVGSPTFGTWDSVLIDDVDRKAVYLAEGLGHAIVSLTDTATVSYLVSEVFNPVRELGINVLDAEVGLVFPPEIEAPLLSPKDTQAPSLSEALAAGLLPTWDDWPRTVRRPRKQVAAPIRGTITRRSEVRPPGSTDPGTLGRHARNNSCGRVRNPALPHHQRHLQAAHADLRQADDLLPPVDADDGGDQRGADYQHAV